MDTKMNLNSKARRNQVPKDGQKKRNDINTHTNIIN